MPAPDLGVYTRDGRDLQLRPALSAFAALAEKLRAALLLY
jgi:hypothetical protein